MRWISIVQHWLLAVVRRRKAETDLDDELRDHFNQEVERNLREGLPPEEARFAAQRLMGSISLYKDECRDERGAAWLEDLRRDLRYALYMMRRAPLFSLSTIVTLALAIGANTFVFTFVEDILLRRLNVPQAERLVSINWGRASNLSYPNYVDLRDRNSTFQELAAARINIVNVSLQPGENSLVWGYEATGNYFQMLRIQPQIGRLFTMAEDNAPGAHPVVVISNRYWREHFMASPSVLGRVIKLNGYEFSVIGVGPPEFTGSELLLQCDFWVPMSMELQIEPGNDWYHSRAASNIWVMGRLKDDVTRAQAEANLNEIGEQITHAYPNMADPRARFHLSQPGLVGDALRTPITAIGMILSGLAAMVLLLACINLAGMLLARAADRQREMAVRLALGADRMRLIRQLLTESLLLAAIGGAAGFALAAASCRLFSSWHPAFDIPFNTTLQPNLAVLGYTVATAALAMLLFGLTPALQSTKTEISPSLKLEARERRVGRFSFRDVLMVAQIGTSVVLVICSALVVRSLQNALTLKLGYVPEHAVSVSFDLRLKDYTAEKSRGFAAEVLRRVSAMPGIEAVGLTDNMPLRLDHGNNNIFSRADRPVPKPSEQRAATIYNITPGYLQAMETQLLAGRDFNGHDTAHTVPVAIVNEAVTRSLFPGESALGKRIRLSLNPADQGLEIVGVVETGKYEYLGEIPHPAVFIPVEQSGLAWATVVARGRLSDRATLAILQKAILDVNPELALSNASSLVDQLALPLFPARMIASLLGIFGLLAMVLAGTGLFAAMAYAVTRKSREIGIRMALGARPDQVLAAVFRRTALLCSIGILFGGGGTLLAGRFLSAVLYGVGPHDPAAFLSALLVIAGVCLLACWQPAHRAVSVDPAQTLRGE